MKKIIGVILMMMVIAMPMLSHAAKPTKDDYVGKKLYVQANMWNEEGKDILSVNYHRGDVIPMGTEVAINSIGGSKIVFTDKTNDKKYNLILSRKHTKLDIFGLADRYFGKDNPLKNKEYKTLNKNDKAYVEEGLICPGMSKDAVVMSYGFPPTHKTPSLDGDVWNYWENRVRRIEVQFQDNEVMEVRGWNFSCDSK